MKNPEVEILYRNHQWMVQKEPKGEFIVEVNERDPEDTEGGYWIRARDLGFDLHFPILHVSEKTWVDIDAFELAVLHAIAIFNIKADYSVAEKFAQARNARRNSGSFEHIGDAAARVIGRIKTEDAA